MKKLTFITVSLLIVVVGLLSCKKEHSCEDCIGNNHPPLALAGPDQVITLPTDSVLLNGGKSSYPRSYLWTKIAGPASVTIANANAATTLVSNLTEGFYQFELKVTNAGGLFSKDTVQVMVESTVCDTLNRATIPIQLVPVAAIPTPRYGFTTATAGNKLLLAGGYTQDYDHPVSDVNIYDLSTQTWSTAHFSTGRTDMTSATVGNKIFFAAGGVDWSLFESSSTSRVDIYDASTNAWSFSDLPSPASSVFSYAVVGSKVFFATDRAPGGKLDVYDTSTGVWSEINLPEQQAAPIATTAGDKVYFAGGSVNYNPSNVVDIYDNATGAWSTTSSLSLPTVAMASIYVNGRIYWAGGYIGYDPVKDRDITTCKVEIRDVSTGSSSFTNLSAPGSFTGNNSKPIYYKNKIIFPQWNYFDIYDPQNNTWSIGHFPQNVFIASVILANNALYAIGYKDANSNLQLPDQIWKLQF